MKTQRRGRAGARRLWLVRWQVRPAAGPAGGLRGVAAATIICVALSCLWPAHAEVALAPTREVASKCRVLAYKAYPVQRPGHVPGSGDRYTLFKGCLDKGGYVDETTLVPAPRPTPAPQLGAPPASQPATQSAMPPPELRFQVPAHMPPLGEMSIN